MAEKLVCFRDLFQGILAQKIPHLAELFAYIAWSIWHNRNAQRVGTTTATLGRIYSDAVDQLQEFQMAQDNPVQQRIVAYPTNWLPPSPNQYKANSDGAIFQDSGSTGLGVVVRDSKGMVIVALSERIALPPTVEDVEALACRKAISPLSLGYRMSSSRETLRLYSSTLFRTHPAWLPLVTLLRNSIG